MASNHQRVGWRDALQVGPRRGSRVAIGSPSACAKSYDYPQITVASDNSWSVMNVALDRPIIYVSVPDLWPTVTLVVLGVVPPASGEPAPLHEQLVSLTVDSDQPVPIHLPIEDGAFRYVALAFAVTTNEVGSITVNIARDEDPLDAGGDRPVAKTFSLERASNTSPLFIMRTFALVGT